MRRDEIYAQLAQVYDPELDQPLTELGFIGGVSIDGSVVTVHFRLPTFWCAAKFAFMMAVDIRERVSELPWVERVDVRLQDHFFEEEINSGVGCGKTFVETFPSWLPRTWASSAKPSGSRPFSPGRSGYSGACSRWGGRRMRFWLCGSVTCPAWLRAVREENWPSAIWRFCESVDWSAMPTRRPSCTLTDGRRSRPHFEPTSRMP